MKSPAGGNGKAKTEGTWLSRADMCRIFEVSEQAFDRHIRPHFPAEAIQRDGRRLAFHARSCIEGWALHFAGLQVGGEDELLAGGGDSPQLERYRRVRADLAELELEQRRGNLVELEQLREAFELMARILRSAGEILQLQCGPEAHEILDDALVELGETFQRHFGKPREETAATGREYRA